LALPESRIFFRSNIGNKGTRRGRKPVPDKTLLRIAKAYVKALSRESRHPVADVSNIQSMTKGKGSLDDSSS